MFKPRLALAGCNRGDQVPLRKPGKKSFKRKDGIGAGSSGKTSLVVTQSASKIG